MTRAVCEMYCHWVRSGRWRGSSRTQMNSSCHNRQFNFSCVIRCSLKLAALTGNWLSLFGQWTPTILHSHNVEWRISSLHTVAFCLPLCSIHLSVFSSPTFHISANFVGFGTCEACLLLSSLAALLSNVPISPVVVRNFDTKSFIFTANECRSQIFLISLLDFE